MANAVWPASLSQSARVIGFELALPATSIQTPMDAGPPKTRRRFTAAPILWTTELVFDRYQASVFTGFFVDTLQGGSLPFDWKHPQTGIFCSMLFRDPGQAPPKFTALDAGIYACVLNLLILP